jgi:chorismate mutase/prephenate dehydratase
MKKKEKPSSGLSSYRSKIDRLDAEILKLLGQRGRLAQSIGKVKQSSGRGIFDPSREKQIFERLAKMNKGPYSNTAIQSIFLEIISATRALESPISVAFLGPVSTFTHIAAVKQFGSSAEFLPQLDIAAVFHEVETNNADYGVVPVENTTEGVVNYTLDRFVDSQLKVCSEIIIPITHHLLSAENRIERVKRVYSHPQALAQCRNWLAQHLPGAEVKGVESTAGAAQRVVSERNAAAIASEYAAQSYGLNRLARNIQDQSNNFTRFLVVGQHLSQRTGNDKTSIVFLAKDRVGILYELLKPLSDSGINLTKIESRPRKTKAWEYLFFVDLDGHVEDRKVALALVRLSEACDFFKILGSYPKAAVV